jgi:hypothetical protein
MANGTGGSRLGEHAGYPGTFDLVTPGHLDIIVAEEELAVVAATVRAAPPTGCCAGRCARERPARW